jgi:diketogulonate reductase-like aldo/keto reductase
VSIDQEPFHSLFATTAFGGWGGLTDEARDKFAPEIGLALKVRLTIRLTWQIFTRTLQEGYRHLDGAWIYRKSHGVQALVPLNALCTQARRSI